MTNVRDDEGNLIVGVNNHIVLTKKDGTEEHAIILEISGSDALCRMEDGSIREISL